MICYLLDTHVCMKYLKGQAAAVRDHLLAIPLTEVAVCSLMKSKLFYGATRNNSSTWILKRQQEFLHKFFSLLFVTKVAFSLGQLRAKIAPSKTPTDTDDLQISAITLANDLILVTRNAQGFEKLEGLHIADWEVEYE